MEGWLEIARNSMRAARLCQRQGYHRTVVSRAYFAVFSACTARLRGANLSPPAGRESWPHRLIPQLIMVHLQNDVAALNEVNRRLRSAYRMRLDADYVSHAALDDETSRRAIADAESALAHLEVVS